MAPPICKRTMKRALAWFVATLAAYAVILYLMGGYEAPSAIYHTLLLAFPVWLITVNRANIRELGLVKGDWQSGLILAIVVTVLGFIIILAKTGLALPAPDVSLASTIVYAPVTEELFFRGYMQPKLESRFGQWPGLVITAILFTVIHLPKVLLTSLAGPLDLIAFFVLGLIFGYVRDVGKSVYYPTLCHVGYNLSTVFG
jgi:membrane protease YdiL (CAAX protease family)